MSQRVKERWPGRATAPQARKGAARPVGHRRAQSLCITARACPAYRRDRSDTRQVTGLATAEQVHVRFEEVRSAPVPRRTRSHSVARRTYLRSTGAYSR